MVFEFHAEDVVKMDLMQRVIPMTRLELYETELEILMGGDGETIEVQDAIEDVVADWVDPDTD